MNFHENFILMCLLAFRYTSEYSHMIRYTAAGTHIRNIHLPFDYDVSILPVYVNTYFMPMSACIMHVCITTQESGISPSIRILCSASIVNGRRNCLFKLVSFKVSASVHR